jgi:cytochrome c
MKTSLIATFAAATFALPAMAQDAGTPPRAKKNSTSARPATWSGDDGTDIVKGGKTGPNLYGVVGRKAGTEEGFKYSDALIKLGEAGEVWTVQDLKHYITDPNSYVRKVFGDKG